MKKVVLLVAIFLLTLATPALPDTLSFNKAHAQGYVDTTAKGFDAAIQLFDMNAEGHIAHSFTSFMADLIRRILGPVIGITTESTDQAYLQEMYQQSLAGGADSMIAYVYANPAASTYAFIQDTGETLGFMPKRVHAQGIGFGGLSPLLPLWKAFRNIAYLLIALYMIVVGFLIMFRQKIDPKTVMTVQNSLPSIVVTLLLITFSYAIVGLLIDAMYLIIMISISILKPISAGVITNDTVNIFTAGAFYEPMGVMLSGGLDGAIRGILGFLGLALPDPGSVANLGDTKGLLEFLVTTTPLQRAKSVVPIVIVTLIYTIAFLLAMIRLLVMLIKAHIQIIMSLIISPFQLLMSVFPGNHAFEGWIKNLIANLAVYPITAIMILIGSIIVRYSSSGTKLWGPPMLNPGGNEGMLGIIGLGVIFAIPSVVNSVKEGLKAKSVVGGGGGVLSIANMAGQQLFTYYVGKRQLENQMRAMQGFQNAPKNEVPSSKG